MKETLTKIIAVCILITFFTACNVVKQVKPTDYLLTESSFYINGKKRKSEELNKLSFQKKNTQLFGIPIQLHIYNLAKPNKDSLFEIWLQKKPNREKKLISKLSRKQLNRLKNSSIGFNQWLMDAGEKPSLLDSLKIKKTLTNLERYYFSNGWFDREINFRVDSLDLKKAGLTFEIQTGNPYKIGNISDNFNVVKTAFTTASTEITDLQTGSCKVNAANNFAGNTISYANFLANKESTSTANSSGVSVNLSLSWTQAHVFVIKATNDITLTFSDFPIDGYGKMKLFSLQ